MNHDESLALPEAELVAEIRGSVALAVASDSAFCAAVMAKLAALENQERRSGGDWLRRAAALLPWGLAPTAFAGSTAAKSAAAKGFLGKTLGAAFLPLFVGGMALASFTSALSKTRNLEGHRKGQQAWNQRGLEVEGWMKQHGRVALGVQLLMVALAFVSLVDAAVLAIAVSMMATSIMTRRLSDQGFCDREALSYHFLSVGFVFTIPVLSFMIPTLSVLGLAPDELLSPNRRLIALVGNGMIWASLMVAAPFLPWRWFKKELPLTPRLRRMDAAVWILLMQVPGIVFLARMATHGHIDLLPGQIRSGELSLLDLRLPLAGLLYVAFVAVTMARAPMPTPKEPLS